MAQNLPLLEIPTARTTLNILRVIERKYKITIFIKHSNFCHYIKIILTVARQSILNYLRNSQVLFLDSSNLHFNHYLYTLFEIYPGTEILKFFQESSYKMVFVGIA